MSESKPTVYLAGPISDGENPFAWHERVEQMENGVAWINPFTIHDDDADDDEIYNGDIEAVREADAILLRRIDDHEVCGAYIEAGFAGANGVPTVVWNNCDSEIPEFLDWHSDAIAQDLETAIQEVANRV